MPQAGFKLGSSSGDLLEFDHDALNRSATTAGFLCIYILFKFPNSLLASLSGGYVLSVSTDLYRQIYYDMSVSPSNPDKLDCRKKTFTSFDILALNEMFTLKQGALILSAQSIVLTILF